MKIDSGSLGMESARSYKATSISYRRYETMDFAGVLTGEQPGESTEETNSEKKGSNKVISTEGILDLQQKMSSVRRDYELRSQEGIQAETIRQQSIMYIFELLFGNFKERFSEWVKNNTSPCIGNGTGIGTYNTEDVSQMLTPVNFTTYEAVDYYSESEETAFSAKGLVKTEDGREIEFNIDVSMSRSFEQKYSSMIQMTDIAVCDPLVINLDGNIASVSDQKIRFDIDGDGELDTINRLSSGSGYLALDKNGDGIINNGTELFGTKSGNGFADLAQYDEDGNGWIDENDDIWSKLRIWVTKEDGSEQLYSLGESGVGAICLQNISTQFSDTDESNSAKAFIRNTGLFLYENGAVGTMQHIDLVRYQKEA